MNDAGTHEPVTDLAEPPVELAARQSGLALRLGKLSVLAQRKLNDERKLAWQLGNEARKREPKLQLLFGIGPEALARFDQFTERGVRLGTCRLIERTAADATFGADLIGNRLSSLAADAIGERRPSATLRVEEAGPLQQHQQDILLDIFAVDIGKSHSARDAARVIGCCGQCHTQPLRIGCGCLVGS